MKIFAIIATSIILNSCMFLHDELDHKSIRVNYLTHYKVSKELEQEPMTLFLLEVEDVLFEESGDIPD